MIIAGGAVRVEEKVRGSSREGEDSLI